MTAFSGQHAERKSVRNVVKFEDSLVTQAIKQACSPQQSPAAVHDLDFSRDCFSLDATNVTSSGGAEDVMRKLMQFSNTTKQKEDVVALGDVEMERRPTFAILVLMLDNQFRPSVQEIVKVWKSLATEKICAKPESLLLQNPSLSSLGTEQLEQLLSNPSMNVEAYTMFRIIQKWSDKDHLSEAQNLVKYIELDKIDPILLGTKVRSSGFVSDTQLVDAFVTQAKASKPNTTTCVWRLSKTDTFTHDSNDCYKTDFIVGRILTPGGTYTWSFCVDDTTTDTWLMMGIASDMSVSPFVGRQRGSWSLSNNGKKFCSGRCKSMSKRLDLSPKATVTFTLSLLRNEDDYMSVSVDGNDPVTLFQGDELQKIDQCGILPSVSICGHCSIRFLGYEK